MQKSKLAHAEWKRAGRPQDQEHFTKICSKRARRDLRRHIRFEISSRRKIFLTSIMDAHEMDSRTFRAAMRQCSTKAPILSCSCYSIKTGYLVAPKKWQVGLPLILSHWQHRLMIHNLTLATRHRLHWTSYS